MPTWLSDFSTTVQFCSTESESEPLGPTSVSPWLMSCMAGISYLEVWSVSSSTSVFYCLQLLQLLFLRTVENLSWKSFISHSFVIRCADLSALNFVRCDSKFQTFPSTPEWGTTCLFACFACLLQRLRACEIGGRQGFIALPSLPVHHEMVWISFPNPFQEIVRPCCHKMKFGQVEILSIQVSRSCCRNRCWSSYLKQNTHVWIVHCIEWKLGKFIPVLAPNHLRQTTSSLACNSLYS